MNKSKTGLISNSKSGHLHSSLDDHYEILEFSEEAGDWEKSDKSAGVPVEDKEILYDVKYLRE